jgi:hypothetical protein
MRSSVIAAMIGVLCSSLFGAAGKITEVTGPTQVSRASAKLEGKIDVGIEMDDTIETLKGRAGITFEDGTIVQCTEFSKLIIDTFVYDPASGKGKIGLKASLGTVRYASGLIAKNNKEEVKVKTPTASISVRGTDFSMTVDELGRSLVILLPSRPELGPPVVGQITVSNGLGTVVLTKAYQATFVASSTVAPSAPVLLNLDDESHVNNMLLIDTPKSVKEAAKEAKKASAQVSKSDDEGSNKKKPESKTSIPQAAETTTATAQQQEQPTPTETKLDINALKPETNKTVMEAISKKVESPAVSIPTTTTNNGFTTDGTRAILYVSNGNNVVWYTLKYDTNANINITTKDGSTDYPLNFGGKLKINIIQK